MPIWSALMKSEKIECSSWTFGSVGIQVGRDLFDMCIHVQHSIVCVWLGPGTMHFQIGFHATQFWVLSLASHLWGWLVDTWIRMMRRYDFTLSSCEQPMRLQKWASPWSLEPFHQTLDASDFGWTHQSPHIAFSFLPGDTWKAEPSSSKAGAALFMMFCRRHWDALQTDQTGLTKQLIPSFYCWMRQAEALFFSRCLGTRTLTVKTLVKTLTSGNLT